jgi:CBS domain containing-hemolysin-like protein
VIAAPALLCVPLASGGGFPAFSDLSTLVFGFLRPAHPEHLFLLFVYTGVALSISFVCSLLEGTLLSVRVTELMRRAKAGEEGARLLLEYKQEKVEQGIGAILTLNTVAHTVGASLAGAQAARAFSSDSLPEDVAVAGFSAMLTVAVLVATEIVPKTLGTNYASALAPYVGYGVHALARLLSPLLFVTGFLTRLLSRGEPEGISRGELQALVNMAQHDGAIATEESRVLSNLLDFDALAVWDVMTPRTVIEMIDDESTVRDYLNDESLHGHSRIPVYHDTPDNLRGYVHQREVLLHVARTGDLDALVVKFVRPLAELPEDLPLGKALRSFLDRGDHIAVAQDEFGGTAGLVTLEDVIETMLGVDIVDEADKVADLRALAAELRAKRVARRSPGKEGEGSAG